MSLFASVLKDEELTGIAELERNRAFINTLVKDLSGVIEGQVIKSSRVGDFGLSVFFGGDGTTVNFKADENKGTFAQISVSDYCLHCTGLSLEKLDKKLTGFDYKLINKPSWMKATVQEYRLNDSITINLTFDLSENDENLNNKLRFILDYLKKSNFKLRAR